MPKHVAIALPVAEDAALPSSRMLWPLAFLLLASLAGTVTIAHAQELSERSPIQAEANLAWIRSSGSSDRETLKTRLFGSMSQGQWTHEALIEGLRERDGLSATVLQQRYLWQGKSSWRFTERDYLFAKVQGERDRQSAFRRQTFAALGYGRKLVQQETIELSADLGAGVRRNQDRVTRESDDEGLLNAAMNFIWRLNDSTHFSADVALESGRLSTTTRTRSALTVALGAGLHLEVAHETKNDNGPARQRDAITTVGLAYRH